MTSQNFEILTSKYPRRPVSEGDPAPITINCSMKGPLNVPGGNILCDECGNIIRHNYLPVHKSSGACSRQINRRNKETA